MQRRVGAGHSAVIDRPRFWVPKTESAALGYFSRPGLHPISRGMRQLLITVGAALLVLGLIWPWLGRIGLGHLPGDINVRRPGFSFSFPLGSSIVISIALSVVLTLIARLFRR